MTRVAFIIYFKASICNRERKHGQKDWGTGEQGTGVVGELKDCGTGEQGTGVVGELEDCEAGEQRNWSGRGTGGLGG